MRNIRRAIPFVLILIGLWLLSGCIYVPMFGRPLQGKNAVKQVGDAESRKPLRVGKSNDQDIRRILGEPYAQSDEGRVLAYTWKTQNGITIWPLCFAVDGVDRWSTLVLRMDKRGVLQSKEVLRENEPAINILTTPFSPHLPDDVSRD